jgi:Rpp14/Pop5 family
VRHRIAWTLSHILGGLGLCPVRFYDASQTNLMLLRVPRDVVATVRASLAFVTAIRARRVALHTVSVHGSARTAKLATVRRIRSYYRDQVLQMRHRWPQGQAGLSRVGQLCSMMEEQLNTLQNIDF